MPARTGERSGATAPPPAGGAGHPVHARVGVFFLPCHPSLLHVPLDVCRPAHARWTRQRLRLAPLAAVAPKQPQQQGTERRQPAMRPLSPSDAVKVAQRHGGHLNGSASSSGSSTRSSATAISNGVAQPASTALPASLRPDLVPMRYSGPPPGNGSSASASSSSGRTVGVTVSSSGAVSAGSSGAVPGGAMLYRQSVPAATAVRSAAGSLAGAVPPGAASGSTFQRSMMVAGFEEGECRGWDARGLLGQGHAAARSASILPPADLRNHRMVPDNADSSQPDLGTDYQYSWAQVGKQVFRLKGLGAAASGCLLARSPRCGWAGAVPRSQGPPFKLAPPLVTLAFDVDRRTTASGDATWILGRSC